MAGNGIVLEYFWATGDHHVHANHELRKVIINRLAGLANADRFKLLRLSIAM